MSKKHFYRCNCYIGNMSTLETEMIQNSFIKFLNSFRYEDFEKTKIDALNDGVYHYQFYIEFSDLSMLKIRRFSESLIQFCLFWNISIHEINLT